MSSRKLRLRSKIRLARECRQILQRRTSKEVPQAEEVIAEDSKDFFYNMEKQRYLGFEIIRINYSENYHESYSRNRRRGRLASPRVGVMRVKPPMTSLWKQENGKWCWYVVHRRIGILPGAKHESRTGQSHKAR